MKAEITFAQLYWNCSLMDFFFREQSKMAVDDLMAGAEDPKSAIDKIDQYTAEYDIDTDELEEIFYTDSPEELAERFGIELKEYDESDDEEYDEDDE